MIRNPITGNILPANWKLVSVNEIKATEKYSCVAGPFGSDISSQYFKSEGVPVIRGNNLSLANEKFIPEGFVFVSNERAAKYKAQHVKANDLVFTCWGTLGQVGIIPENGPYNEYIISNKQLKLRVNEELVNPQFLYYYFSSKAVVQFLNNIAIGSAVPGINLGILKKFPVTLPTKPIQNIIAKLLDNYFNLIENNNQRIKLLEEMAEEIYKEWFVRFRFPSYETSKFFNEEGQEVARGTHGALPEGWDKAILDDFVRNIKNPYDEILHSNLEILDLARMPRKSLCIPALGDSDDLESSRIIFEKNDILFGSIRSYFHKVSFPGKKGITNVSVLVLRPKENMYRAYSLMTVFSNYFINWSTAFSNGTKMPTISWKEVKCFKVNKPSDSVLKSFEEKVFPMIEEIQILSEKNQVLQQTRDLLLPRLISGKLSVEHLVEEEYENLAMAAEPTVSYGKN